MNKLEFEAKREELRKLFEASRDTRNLAEEEYEYDFFLFVTETYDYKYNEESERAIALTETQQRIRDEVFSYLNDSLLDAYQSLTDAISAELLFDYIMSVLLQERDYVKMQEKLDDFTQLYFSHSNQLKVPIVFEALDFALAKV